MKKSLSTLLMRWNYLKNGREMPWKGEKDPYLIWLSEIILQQTRVEQGLPYFLRFKQKYPTVKDLAAAPEDEVMKLWQGLGYYSRARNLHSTAKYIVNELKGNFPGNYEGLKALKGVGDYTAAAIASFAFGEKRAVVDGNVIRVLSRTLGINTPFDTTGGKKQFAELAMQLIDEKEPGVYNQSIMDFGATVCTPRAPLCNTCPLQKICVAYNKGIVDELPVRAKKTAIRPRYFNYLLITNGKHIIVQKRTGQDIWKGLYQLPLIETDTPLKRNFNWEVEKFLGTEHFNIKGYSKETTQLLTHRKIHFRFIEIELLNFNSFRLSGTKKVKVGDLGKLAFPKTIHLYLLQNSLL